MADKYLLKIGEQVKGIISGDFKIEDVGTSVVVSGDMNVGVKDFSVSIEISESRIKIKGSREYEYPISSEAADDFGNKMIVKYSDYTTYISGQYLNFSKFRSYSSDKEAFEIVKDAVAVMQDVVLTFESTCVNFLEKTEDDEKEDAAYDPEKNIDIVNVDNTYQVVSMSEKDNANYVAEHAEFAKEVFESIAQKYAVNIVHNKFYIKKDDKIISCILNDEEITVSVAINAPKDVGAMYKSYINAHYGELLSSYKEEDNMFIVKSFVTPDKYIPEETEETINLCMVAIDSCVREYKSTITKKDSAAFVSDVQQILSEQTEALSLKEEEISQKEEELKKREAMLYEREEELENRIIELNREKEELVFQIQEAREKISEKEQEMEDRIKEYEERNTSDILKIKQLADQVAALQNKQSMLGQSDNGSEEEIFRLKAKVKQLTGQKIALEKNLTEKITAKDSKIRDMSDTISEKDREYKKLEENIDDMVNSRVAEEVKKNASKMKDLEASVAKAGHEITPEELIKYLRKFNPDGEFRKCHSANAKYVVYNDESLDIRIRFSDTDYVDISKEAKLKDEALRKLNSQNPEIKFFGKDKKIIARKYFNKTATPEEVDEVIESLSSFFAK